MTMLTTHSTFTLERRYQAGHALTYEARYVDIVPNQRILTTSTLHTEERLSTVSVTSVEFRSEGANTMVVLTEHGVYLPGQEQPQWREHGTAQHLDSLAEEFADAADLKEN
jgi:uncharacterized protein YndB with AHSA1/START domain